MRNKGKPAPKKQRDALHDLEPVIREVGVREVARRTGLSPATISLWLSGRNDMSYQNVRSIAHAVGYVVRAVPVVKDEG